MVLAISIGVSIIILLLNFYSGRNTSLQEVRLQQARGFTREQIVRKQINNLLAKIIGEKKKSKIEVLCLQANLPLKPGEFLLISFGSALIGALFGQTIGIVGIFTGLVVGSIIPYLCIKWLRNKRIKDLHEQVGQTLTLLVHKVIETGDYTQAFRYAAQEITEEPMGIELKKVATQLDLGVPLLDAMEEWALKVDNPFATLFANYSAMINQYGTQKIREEILSEVVKMHDKHLELQSEAKKQLFGAKFQAGFLVVFVPGLFIFKSITDPKYLPFMTTTFIGQATLLIAIIILAAAILFINTKIAAPLDE